MKQKYETPKKTRNYNVRFDYDLKEFFESQPNRSEFLNRLVRQEKERIERAERVKIEQILKSMKDGNDIKGGIL